MSEKFEKVMIYIIVAVFAVALMGNTVLGMFDIRIPGVFAFALALCAVLLLITLLLKPEKRRIDIILVSLAAAIGIVSGILQIVL